MKIGFDSVPPSSFRSRYLMQEWDLHSPTNGTFQSSTDRRLAAPCLGRHGRWGNTVLQYMFLKAFAKQYDYQLETPEWLGSHLFGVTDPPLGGRYGTVVIDGVSEGVIRTPYWPTDWARARAGYVASCSGRDAYVAAPRRDQLVNEDIPFSRAEMDGLFLVHTSLINPHRNHIQLFCEPVPSIKECFEPTVAKLRSLGNTIVGLHIRRGDFVESFTIQGNELITPLSTYRKWLQTVWPQLDNPVLFVASDAEDVCDGLSEFTPVTSRLLNVHLPKPYDALVLPMTQCQRTAEFFPDWYLLTQCDLMAISNSTFSFSAALLNHRAKLFMRPTFQSEDLVQFEPWDSEPSLFLEPKRHLLCDLLQRVAPYVRVVGMRGISRALCFLALGYVEVLRLRLEAVHRKHGWSSLARTVIDPGLFIATEYRLK